MAIPQHLKEQHKVVTRRTLVKGAAWASPVIAFVAAAPASAASCTAPGGCPIMASHGTVSNAFGNPPCTNNNYSQYTWNGATNTSSTSNPGVTFTTTTTASTITNVTITIWLPVSGLTWTVGSGTDTGWSAPTSTGTTTTSGGVTFYGYTTTFGGTVTPVAGTTALKFSFTSSCTNFVPTAGAANGKFDVQTSAMVNGESQTLDSGFRALEPAA